MSNSCDRLVFQRFNVYPWRTTKYTDTSKLGCLDSLMMYFKSVTYKITLTDHGEISRVKIFIEVLMCL